MTDPDKLDVHMGWIAAPIADEFPDLRMYYVGIDGGVTRRSPPELLARLRELSNHFRGSTAIAMRSQPIPHAYRVFFRHIGIDPDRTLPPQEALALERLKKGRFEHMNSLDDTLRVALMETGVPVWAFDADTLSGPLGLRVAESGERLGRVGSVVEPAPAGRIVIADEEGPIGLLFGHTAEGHGVSFDTRRMTLYTIQVKGVPSIHVEEALWQCAQWLG